MQALEQPVALSNGISIKFATNTDEGGFMKLKAYQAEAEVFSEDLNFAKVNEIIQKLQAVFATARVG